MIKAVLFDFDGTLVDTNSLIIRTLEEAFAHMSPDRKFTKAEILDCIGPTLEQTGKKYFYDDFTTFVEYYRELNHKYHDEMIEVYPGIQQMLEALKHKGLNLAIVTSKRRDFAIKGLKKAGLFQFLIISSHQMML